MQLLKDTNELVVNKFKKQNPKRLKHILGVVKMAKHLAKIYDIDEAKAEIAALMHDYCKYDDINEIKKLLSNEEISECEKYPFLYHAKGSAYIYKKLFNNYDEDIFNAIYNHVFGRLNMSRLEEIIMISDYTEENREYESCIKCRDILLNNSIEEAIVYSLEKTLEHHNDAHPTQLEIIKEYKERINNK